VLGLPTILALVVGFLALRSPREYTASASFVPQDPSQTSTGLSQIAGQFGLITATRANTNSPQFYVDLLQTRDVLREVVTTPYKVSGDTTLDLIQFFGIKSSRRQDAIATGVAALRSRLAAYADRQTGVVHFEVSTTNPELSRLIANRLLELTNDFNLRRRQSQAKAEREFVERRLTQAKADLTAAEDALSDFARRNRQFESPELSAEQQRLQRQVAFKQQLYSGLQTSMESATLEEVRNTPMITVIDGPDGFVAPKPRGSAGKAILAFFVGLVVAIGLAFTLDYVARERRESSTGYEEFLELRRRLTGDIRRVLLPRLKRPSEH
jgi:uncharacterized protein involved in exopolysaccharide biosynthesis